MSILESGALRGFYAPEYDEGSILNLMSSLIRSRGGTSPHAELSDLPSSALERYERIVYLVLDGIGEEQLARHLDAGRGKHFFAETPRRVLTTVFPATTAAAVTTFATGASPLEHGIIGWFLNFPDLGSVSTVLLVEARAGTDLVPDDFPLKDYLAIPSYVESVACPTVYLAHEAIPFSRYSLAGTRWGERHSVKSLGRLERRISEFAKREGRGLAHAYWPVYDTVCHDAGTASEGASQHLDELDRFLARLAGAATGTGCLIVVTSDHGLVDVPLERNVNLSSVPGLYDCLATLPSGDARCVHCFVRPSKTERFLEIARGQLSAACAAIPGEVLIECGWFGPGRPHPSLRARAGDWVLLAREGWALSAPRAFEEWKPKRGNHGGASPTEMRVPLWTIE